MNEEGGDFITVLSSDMITDIMQVYFDKELYTKKKVKIVDSKPQGDGYAFTLAFVQVDAVQNKKTSIYSPTIHNGGIYQPVTPHAYNAETGQDTTRYTNADVYDVMPGGTPVKRDSKGKFVKREVVDVLER